VPVMGRLEQVTQCLPALAALPNTKTILVDWSCPQHTGE